MCACRFFFLRRSCTFLWSKSVESLRELPSQYYQRSRNRWIAIYTRSQDASIRHGCVIFFKYLLIICVQNDACHLHENRSVISSFLVQLRMLGQFLHEDWDVQTLLCKISELLKFIRSRSVIFKSNVNMRSDLYGIFPQYPTRHPTSTAQNLTCLTSVSSHGSYSWRKMKDVDLILIDEFDDYQIERRCSILLFPPYFRTVNDSKFLFGIFENHNLRHR